jgi:hypothetical protein
MILRFLKPDSRDVLQATQSGPDFLITDRLLPH